MKTKAHLFNWEEGLQPLVVQDFTLRNVLKEKGILTDAYHPEMEKLHLKNAHKLSKLITNYGFPVLSNAGQSGVKHSWVIILHSISWPSFMRESLIQMRFAAAQDDYPLDLLAYVEDRVAYFEGRPQLYGTQCDWIEGELKRTPIDDESRVQERRQSMGLPPLTAEIITDLDRPPRDPVKKEREFKAWLVKVGWRIS